MAQNLAVNVTQESRRKHWYSSPRMLSLVEMLLSNSLLAATVILVIVYTIIARDRNFFSFGNLVNILMAATITGFATWAMAVAMLAGNIDWSTRGVSVIASILLGELFMQKGWGAIPTILGVCAASILVSLFTSFLIVNFKIPSLVATIAVNGSYVAIAMYLCNNYQINIRRPGLEEIFIKFRPLNIPFSVWLMLIFFGFAWVMLYHTKLGAHIYATGANANTARLNGVNVNRVIRITLMWSAVCVAMAGIIGTTRGGITLLYGSTGGYDALVYAFGPVMLGGVSLFGGRGRLENMLVAILFVNVLNNGLFLMHATTGIIQTANGLVFLLALMMSSTRDMIAQIKS